MGVRTYETREPVVFRAHGPSTLAVLVAFAVVLLGLVANGRPIGGAPQPLEAALLGKLAASSCLALAAALLFSSVAYRRPTDEAWIGTMLFAFGTVAWACAQSWSASAAATAFVALAVLAVVKGEGDPAWTPRASLPLALAVAANPVDVALASVMALATLVRRPRQAGLFVLWSLPGLAAISASLVFRGPFAWPASSPASWPENAAAVLASPGAGLFFFAPVVLVALAGLVRAAGSGEGPLALSCAAGFLAHASVLAFFPIRAGTFGPVCFTDALPLVLLFVPDGLDALKTAGKGLAVLSVAIQLLGAFSYDGRWDRLYGPAARPGTAWIWDPAHSPIPFQVNERVGILASPEWTEGHALLREHRFAVLGATGSRLSAASDRLVIEGVDASFGNLHLLGGARVESERIVLAAVDDGVFLRLRPDNRSRRLELRIAGRGKGTLAVSEGSFWRPVPKTREKVVGGDFRWALPYHYPESGGGDIRVRLRSGRAEIAWVSLVPASEPDDVIRLRGEPES